MYTHFCTRELDIIIFMFVCLSVCICVCMCVCVRTRAKETRKCVRFGRIILHMWT